MIETLYAYFLQHRKICTDTRKIEPQAIFFALKGDNFNGNKFAAAALDGGCAYAVVDEPQDTEDPRFIMVDDVLATLQQLSRHHREQLNIPVIGITGSNGKTTTKELMQAVLNKRFNTWATQGNLNNHIGVPLTLLSITPEHEVAIIEMGANHQGEIGTLCSFAQPDYGLITNIGKAHLEGFGGVEGVIKAKRQLYDHLRQHEGTVFVNMDNPLLADLSEGMNIISYGTAPERDFVGAVQPDGLTLALTWRTQSLSDQSVTTSLVGDYNFENALAAIAVGWQFGVGSDAIGEALAAYVPQNKRSQLLRQNDREIVLDAYNANPVSMQAALANFLKLDPSGSAVILGDMLELGEYSAAEHQHIVDMLKDAAGLQVFLVGSEFQATERPAHFEVFDHVSGLIERLEARPTDARHLLIKGSRGIRLEKVLEVLD